MKVSTCGFLIVIAIILTNIVTEATREPERIVEVVYIEIPTQQEENPTEEEQEPQSNKKSLGVFTVTAYCPCESCTSPYNDGYTFTGDKATEGVTVATYPEQIPLGTEIYIEGIGERVSQDIGGSIYENRIDLFMSDHQAALNFGVQELEIWEVVK